MNIPRFSPRQPLTADALNKLGDAIRAYRVTSFVGGRIEQNTGGTSLILTAQTGGGGGGATTLMPFEVVSAPTDPDAPEGRPLFKINPESYIFKSQGSVEVVQIDPLSDPTKNQKFNLPEAPGAIYLAIEFDEKMAITKATLEKDPISDWPEKAGIYPWPIERDKEATGANYLRQKKLYIVIAEVSTEADTRDGTTVDDDGDKKRIIQLVKEHLLLDWQIIDGIAAKIAVPWQGLPQLAGGKPPPNPNPPPTPTTP